MDVKHWQIIESIHTKEELLYATHFTGSQDEVAGVLVLDAVDDLCSGICAIEIEADACDLNPMM